MTDSRTALASQWPPTAAVAARAGHQRMSPLQAIRRKCLDCCGHQHAEVRFCEAIACPLWPFRAGRHPYTKNALQEADSDHPACGGSQVPENAASSIIALQEADCAQGARDAP